MANAARTRNKRSGVTRDQATGPGLLESRGVRARESADAPVVDGDGAATVSILDASFLREIRDGSEILAPAVPAPTRGTSRAVVVASTAGSHEPAKVTHKDEHMESPSRSEEPLVAVDGSIDLSEIDEAYILGVQARVRQLEVELQVARARLQVYETAERSTEVSRTTDNTTPTDRTTTTTTTTERTFSLSPTQLALTPVHVSRTNAST